MVVGFNNGKESSKVKDPLEDYYGVYSLEEIPEDIRPAISEEESQEVSIEQKVIDSKESPVSLDGPMDSAWPMYCHDTRHTGRSPFSTTSTVGIEKWKFWTEIDGIPSGIVISNDGTIYFSGSYDLYALYPNGTQKWRYEMIATVLSCPAIDENGNIYVGTAYVNKNLYAINPNGTLKWKFPAQIFSSPAIGNDGTIYFGDTDNNINALYSNGTLKWKYKTNNVVYSSPAIGFDGTIYCGSHDTYLYALYPNNGTLKWRYKTGDWIRTSPCIADDGTILVVSLDYYLYAVNPNGTLKWKTKVGAGTSPTIGQDGTIYCGYEKLCAINPNGSVKWTFDVKGELRGAIPCNSIDGTIYLGNGDGSDIIAVNPDGTEKWRVSIGGDVESAPAIGEDGTVYIGSRLLNGGYLHAFGPLDSDAPSAPIITGKTIGIPGVEYDYKFKSTSPVGRNLYYYITWGDGSKKDWFGPFGSGEEVTVSHAWTNQGTYTIRTRAKDTENMWGPWGELQVTMPRDKSISNSLLLRFLERYSLLNRLLSLIELQ